MRIVRVGEKFNFAHTLRDFARASTLPQHRDAAVDERRTDGTLLDREQIVGGQLEVSRSKRGVGLHLQTGPVAVTPWRRGVDFDLRGQFKFRSAAQSLAQNFFLDFKLMLIIRVLVVASPATSEVRASGLHAVGRRPKNRFSLRACKTWLLLGE